MTGIHLTANAYVPTYLLKELAATEYKGELSLGKLSESYSDNRENLQFFFSKIFIFKSYSPADLLKGLTLADINELQLGYLRKSIQEFQMYIIILYLYYIKLFLS